MENTTNLETYLKNIRENIDKIIEEDKGVGSIFNSGFNYSLCLLDAKLNEKDLNVYDYIDLIFKTLGVNLDEIFTKYVESHSDKVNNPPQTNIPDETKIQKDVVDFITNNFDITDNRTIFDYNNVNSDEYKEFINNNINELKKNVYSE